MATVGRSSPPDREIWRAWERFNSDELDDPAVLREPVFASWKRSKISGVRPDVLDVRHDADTETESRFLWAANPVLTDLAERLSGTSNAILLADRKARVVNRWVLEPGLLPGLDRLSVIETALFAEGEVGTNGMGSPAEERRPFVVAGPEHYRECYKGWTCVGAPVVHPITRQLEGVVDITCLYRDTNDLILPMVVDAARHVEERLFQAASRVEQTLLRHYLPAAGSPHRAVTVLSDKTIISNPLAARLLQNVDQPMLWEHACRALAARVEAFHQIPLGHGDFVEARCTPIRDGAELVGALVEFRREATAKPAGDRRRRTTSPKLEGLAGRSVVWLAACADAIRQVDHGLPLLVAGEPGVGKLSLVRALHARSAPELPLSVVDCGLEPVEGPQVWVERSRGVLVGEGAVVFRHLEALRPEAATAAAVAIDEALSDGRTGLYATLTSTAQPSAECVSLMERFAGRVIVPPLRQRPEDVGELVAAITRRHDTRVPSARFSPEALQTLMRGDWPQNVRQLENSVRSALCSGPGPEIGVDSLPRDVKSQATRRRLSAMEQVELDAIVAALERFGDNRTRAAEALGISRATLHRRLRAYGLQLGRSAF